MGVVEVGVEKEIGQAQSRQVQGLRQNAPREQDPVGRHAAGLHLAAEIGLHRRAAGLQPEHAARHPRENPHPHIEDHGLELVAVVDAGKYEAGLGQTVVAAMARRGRDRLLAVGD